MLRLLPLRAATGPSALDQARAGPAPRALSVCLVQPRPELSALGLPDPEPAPARCLHPSSYSLKWVSISARRPPRPPPPPPGLPACTDRWCLATAPTAWPRALSSSRRSPARPAAPPRKPHSHASRAQAPPHALRAPAGDADAGCGRGLGTEDQAPGGSPGGDPPSPSLSPSPTGRPQLQVRRRAELE